MTIVRVQNVDRWVKAEPGKALVVGGDVPTTVRLECNCPEPTRFDLVPENGDAVFLAVVEGMGTLEFSLPRMGELFATTDEPWFYVGQGSPVVDLEAEPEKSFTRVYQRKVRNPDLELMMFKQEQNARRREAKQRDELAQFMEMLRDQQAAQAAAAAAEGASVDGETGELNEGNGATGGAAAEPDKGGTVDVAAVATKKGNTSGGTASA